MTQLKIDGRGVFIREAGEGIPIVCLHAALSSSSQWQNLFGALQSRFRLVAPDFFGEGKSEALVELDPEQILKAEMSLVEKVILRESRPVCLIGHSYGGVLALRAALEMPEHVSQLVVIEPVAFHLIKDDLQAQSLGLETQAVQARCLSELQSGQPLAAAESFITYWGGPRAWAGVPEAARPFLANVMPKICAGWEAVTREPQTFADYGAIDVPTLVISGTRGPGSIRRVAARLAETIPGSRHQILEGAGHLSPLTHSAAVIEAISWFVLESTRAEVAALGKVRKIAVK